MSSFEGARHGFPVGERHLQVFGRLMFSDAAACPDPELHARVQPVLLRLVTSRSDLAPQSFPYTDML